MYLIIDNYDSFTYNLFQYMSLLTKKRIEVYRNDEINLEEIKAKNPEGIVISPGPGRPSGAGICLSVVKEFAGKIPILGVCLGHQVIAAAFGGKIVQAKSIVHGKVQAMQTDGRGLFRNIPKTAQFTRYHSLVVEKSSIPQDFEITATSVDGQVMGIRHKKHLLECIQFHPESIASSFGKTILKNFLSYKREPFSISKHLKDIIQKEDMSFAKATSFMDEVTEGNLTSAQIAAFLVALSSKGITPSEIAGCASVLIKKRVALKSNFKLLDTCGTGGDGKMSLNISSISAIIAASCGAKVAKHGNRAVSSSCGSADFFSNLGININLLPKQSTQMIKQTGFAFLFAPIYHSAMRFCAVPRAELGIKTIMNLVGPLSNPASAAYQIIGVYDQKLLSTMAKAAKLLGVERVLAVCSDDGMDEISTSTGTKIIQIDKNNKRRDIDFHPNSIGLKTFSIEKVRVASAKQNVDIAKRIFDNTAPMAATQIVLLNTAGALVAAGLAKDMKEGYEAGEEALKSGKAKRKLKQIIQTSKKLTK